MASNPLRRGSLTQIGGRCARWNLTLSAPKTDSVCHVGGAEQEGPWCEDHVRPVVVGENLPELKATKHVPQASEGEATPRRLRQLPPGSLGRHTYMLPPGWVRSSTVLGSLPATVGSAGALATYP